LAARLGQLLEAGLRAAEEEMFPRPWQVADRLLHEVWAIDSVLQVRPFLPHRPDQRHSIRQQYIKLLQRRPEIRPLPRQRNDVRIAGRHSPGLLVFG